MISTTVPVAPLHSPTDGQRFIVRMTLAFFEMSNCGCKPNISLGLIFFAWTFECNAFITAIGSCSFLSFHSCMLRLLHYCKIDVWRLETDQGQVSLMVVVVVFVSNLFCGLSITEPD